MLSQTVSFCPFNEKVLVYVFLEKVALLTSTHFMVVGLVLSGTSKCEAKICSDHEVEVEWMPV